VGRGRLVGLRQVQILPGTPASRSRAELPVELHNLRNTSLRGELLVESMLDNAPLRERRDVTLEAGARAVYTIALPAIPSNGWPLQYTFRSELGEERWQEVMQPTGIAPFPAGVKFEDDDAWSRLPATHILRVGPAERNPIEAAWLPFLKGQESTDATTQRAEVRVAWDEQYLYLDARITAAAPLPKQALARWDEEQYFHSSASAQKDARYADFARGKDIDWSRAAYVYAAEFRAESPWSGDVFQFAIDVDAPADRYRRTHDLSFQIDRLPTGFHTVPDTDFEFALYDTVGGGSELWCILAPDMPRVHHHPRQLRGDVRQHAVTNAKHRTAYVDGVRVYRVGVPWKTLGLAPKSGTDVGLTFRLNQNKIGPVDYGIDRAIKNNGLTLHPYFASSPACVARWTLMENP